MVSNSTDCLADKTENETGIKIFMYLKSFVE